MHLKGNRFVGRKKVNAQYEVTTAQAVQGNILEDQTIRLTSEKGKKCPISLRRIHFVRQDDEKEIVLISNDLTSPTEELRALYKHRWQIELFFKWIKQNLKIKRFFGTSEQAVYLKVLIAMNAYLLLKLVNISLSTLHVTLQLLNRLISANLFQRKSPKPSPVIYMELQYA